VEHGPSDVDALLLASGKLVAEPIGKVTDLKFLDDVIDPLLQLCTR